MKAGELHPSLKPVSALSCSYILEYQCKPNNLKNRRDPHGCSSRITMWRFPKSFNAQKVISSSRTHHRRIISRLAIWRIGRKGGGEPREQPTIHSAPKALPRLPPDTP